MIAGQQQVKVGVKLVVVSVVVAELIVAAGALAEQTVQVHVIVAQEVVNAAAETIAVAAVAANTATAVESGQDAVGVVVVAQHALVVVVHQATEGWTAVVECSIVRFTLHGSSCPQLNVCLNLFLGHLNILRQSSHLEHGLLVPGGGHDVGVGLLLDPLDGGALGPDHEADHPVGDPDLDGCLAGGVGHHLSQGQCGVDVVLPGGSDLREVLGCAEDLSLSAHHVLLPPGDNKHRLLSSHRGLDVRVGLGSQCLDFAT